MYAPYVACFKVKLISASNGDKTQTKQTKRCHLLALTMASKSCLQDILLSLKICLHMNNKKVEIFVGKFMTVLLSIFFVYGKPLYCGHFTIIQAILSIITFCQNFWNLFAVFVYMYFLFRGLSSKFIVGLQGFEKGLEKPHMNLFINLPFATTKFKADAI